MADQKRWFKVWVSILDDPHFQELSLEDIGRWTLLGAMTAFVGNRDQIASPNASRRLREVLRVESEAALRDAIQRLPSVAVEEGKNSERTFVVTWRNWHKYQKDAMAAQRMKTLRSKRRGEEEEKKKRKLSPPSPSSHSTTQVMDQTQVPMNGWGHPGALVALYNELVPAGHPRVTDLTPGRRAKAKRYLTDFPDQAFWTRVFTEIGQSPFLRGLRPSADHKNFRGDFDWLLTVGKDGTENCVKVAEGRFREPAASGELFIER